MTDNRYVRESDVIKAIDKHTREDGTLDDDISCILEEISSVDAKDTNVPSKWIPCSERLPEAGKYVLVSFENDGLTLPDIATYEIDEQGSGAFYPSDCDATYTSVGIFVNAWMPLPEPYKGGEQMLEKKAIMDLMEYIGSGLYNANDPAIYLQTATIAIEALEKRIPKKIKIWNGQASCPCCDKLFGDMNVIRALVVWEMDYCKYCGQSIDWSEEVTDEDNLESRR